MAAVRQYPLERIEKALMGTRRVIVAIFKGLLIQSDGTAIHSDRGTQCHIAQLLTYIRSINQDDGARVGARNQVRMPAINEIFLLM